MRLAEIIPEGRTDKVAVEHFTVSKADSRRTAIRAVLHPDEFVPPGKYVRLRINNAVVMSDTPMEQDTNAPFIHAARGDVLIVGLGLGLVIAPLLGNRSVKSLTVIEKSPEVVKLVAPHLRRLAEKNGTAYKFDVITADVWKWRPLRSYAWDTIYFDIWTNLCTDNLKDITRLRRKFARRLRRAGWMGAWQERELKRRDRVGLY